MKKTALFALPLCVLLACKSEPKPDAPAPVQAKAQPAASVAAPSAAKPAGNIDAFEGQIVLLTSNKSQAGKQLEVTLRVKTGRLRVDLPESAMAGQAQPGKAYQIIDIASGTVKSVADGPRIVMVMDATRLADQVAQMGGASKPEKEPQAKVEKTGKTDTVAGRACEEWSVTAEGHPERRTICVAKMGASWMKFPFKEETWAQQLFDGAHFPLRVVSYAADGSEQTRIEVKSIDEQPVDESLFMIPTDYKVMDMSQMVGGMAAMAAGGSAPGAAGAAGAAGMPTLPNGVTLPAHVREMMEKMKQKQQQAQQQQGLQK